MFELPVRRRRVELNKLLDLTLITQEVVDSTASAELLIVELRVATFAA